MAQHTIGIHWHKQGEFSHEGFERRHDIQFGPALSLPAGGAHNDFGADPEQLLAAALGSCYMQTFLALAAKKRLVVASYEDSVSAETAQRDDGKTWISVIRLSPKVVFSGDKQPDATTLQSMHDKAHQHCFVANSVLSEVVVTPRH